MAHSHRGTHRPEYFVPDSLGAGLGVVMLGGVAFLLAGVLGRAGSRRLPVPEGG